MSQEPNKKDERAETRSHAPKMLVAPGTPEVVNLYIGLLRHIRVPDPDCTIVIMPSAYLKKPRPSKFAKELTRLILAEQIALFVAWEGNALRFVSKTEAFAYIEACATPVGDQEQGGQVHA